MQQTDLLHRYQQESEDMTALIQQAQADKR